MESNTMKNIYLIKVAVIPSGTSYLINVRNRTNNLMGYTSVVPGGTLIYSYPFTHH